MFRNRLYLAVVSSHFAVDTLNSLGPVLLAVLALPLGLSNAQIGFALTLYLLANSLSQPLFGWLADRVPNQSVLLAGLGVAWLALFFCVIALFANWTLLLVCFALAPLGSGLFHPIGTASAATAHPDRANSATAVFFFCGQMGLALGPVLGGFLFASAGNLGVLPLALLALLPAGLLMSAGRVGQVAPDDHETGHHQSHPDRSLPRHAHRGSFQTHHWRRLAQVGQWLSLAVLAFVLLVAVRSSIQVVYQSFLPKLFADRAWTPQLYGLLAGTFMGAAATGNVFMGDLADRFGMRVATVVPLLLSVPAGLVCLAAPSVAITFVAAGLSGVLVGGQHSILVVHAQNLLPTGRRFAAGLILGFTFASGAIGAWCAGLLADVYGLPIVMQAVTWMGLVAALLALTLPQHQGRMLPTDGIERSTAYAPGVIDVGQVAEPPPVPPSS